MNHSAVGQPSNPLCPVIMTLAGFDPSCGAGVVADLKTFAAHNCYGVAAVTALTVQNTCGVRLIRPVDVQWLKQQIDALLSDGTVTAFKLGVLGSRENAEAIRDVLDSHPSLPCVLDPVLRSSSGMELTDPDAFVFLRDELLGRVTVATPNVHEASALTGVNIDNVEHMKMAARKLVDQGARAVVITGGPLEKAVDVYFDGSDLETFVADRVKVDHTHGTGCTFASAVTANLALGRQLRDAVMLAKAYVTEAIRKSYPVGPGRVPLNHLFRMQQPPRVADPTIPEPVH
jgi:hydroxymethylpyrimidine/phosphomethylpyrimidine kinase